MEKMKMCPMNGALVLGGFQVITVCLLVLFLNESAYTSYSVLAPQWYVGCVWANMLVCFIGLEIKKNCT